MRALRTSGAPAAAVAAALLLAGCDPHAQPGRTTGSEQSDNGTPFTDPQKAEIYKELTRPLKYRGGDKNSRCGAWEADTPEDAAIMRKAHQRCVSEGWHP